MDMVDCWTVERTCLAHARRHPHPWHAVCPEGSPSVGAAHPQSTASLLLQTKALVHDVYGGILPCMDYIHCTHIKRYSYGE